jgi:signal transduction histidine kinase
VEIRRLQLQLLGAETAHRGYLISGFDDESAQFRRLALAAQQQLAVLEAHFGSSPERRAILQEVQTLAQRRLTMMDDVARLVDAGQAEQALALARSGLGSEDLVRLDDLITQTATAEQRRQQAERGALLESLAINRWAITALVLLGMLAMAGYLRHAQQLRAERAERARLLQAERDRLETEVERRTHELRELARHLQTAREDERSHLARELHDELGGLLTAAKLDVARLRKQLQQPTPELLQRVQHLVATLDAGIALKRRIIEDLRPSSLSNLGLQPALQILCSEFAQRSEISVYTELQVLKLPEDIEITLYRVLQEALTNISKYAQARRVDVRLRVTDGQAELSVADDGQGFDPARVGPQSRGLAGMRFRLESCAGSLRVDSLPGQGTRIGARVPAAASAVSAVSATPGTPEPTLPARTSP